MIDEPSISNYTPEQQARALDWIIHDLRMEKPMGTTTAEMPDFGADVEGAEKWIDNQIQDYCEVHLRVKLEDPDTFIIVISGDVYSMDVEHPSLNTAVRMALAAWRAREEA